MAVGVLDDYLARFRRTNAACFAPAKVVIWGRRLTEKDKQPEWRAASPSVLGDYGPLVLQHSFARDRNTHRLRVYKGNFELGEGTESHVRRGAAVAVRPALYAACSQQRRGLNLPCNTRQTMVGQRRRQGQDGRTTGNPFELLLPVAA